MSSFMAKQGSQAARFSIGRRRSNRGASPSEDRRHARQAPPRNTRTSITGDFVIVINGEKGDYPEEDEDEDVCSHTATRRLKIEKAATSSDESGADPDRRRSSGCSATTKMGRAAADS